MKISFYRRMVCLWTATLLVFVVPMWMVSAQTAPSTIFEERGTLNNDTDPVYYDLGSLQVGDVVYARLQATSGDLDTYLILADAFDGTIYAENDDVYFGNTDSALVYRVREASDYMLVASRYDDTSSGDYVLTYSINNADVFPFADLRVVQEERGTVFSADEYIFYDLFGLRGGDTVYVYAEAIDDRLDTYIFFGNYAFDIIYAENDDIAPGITDSALFFTVPEDGDYTLAITAYNDATVGDFRVLIGVNAPQVLSGQADVTGGDAIAVAGQSQEVAEVVRPRVQQFRGEITRMTPFESYDLFDMRAGDTLYVYAETISGELDTFIGLTDLAMEEVFIENDDIDADAGNYNSAFAYTFEFDGDYRLVITSAIDGLTGTYDMLIGLNAPGVLTGSASPTNDRIAQLVSAVDIPTDNCDTLFGRPILSGVMQRYETENFIVHYTLEGSDATTFSFVQAVAETMEDVWDFQINQLGWPQPPDDCGEGGDRRYDVYIMELGRQNILGYAQPQGLVGDNPYAPGTQIYAAYSYLAMDNNYAGSSDPLGLMRATAAHEFNHAIQFGYDLRDGNMWYYEATAVWMETVNYPRYQDATGYVAEHFATVGLCLGNVNNDPSGIRIYGEWTLIDSLVQDFGMDVVQALWREIAVVEYMEAFYNLTAKLGTTPQEVMKRYAIRNLLLDYELAHLFGAQVAIAGRINGEGRVISRGTGVQELGVNYLRVMLKGDFSFSVQEENITLYFVGIRGDEADIFALGRSGTVDTRPYSDAYLIMLNTTEHPDANDCTATRWTVDVKPSTTGFVNRLMVWDATRFVKPAE